MAQNDLWFMVFVDFSDEDRDILKYVEGDKEQVGTYDISNYGH